MGRRELRRGDQLPGIWAATPAALGEIQRVLVPGGQVGLTVWGHVEHSFGAWALAPFHLAEETGAVSLGQSGIGENLLARFGFTDIERFDVPFVWEFADPAAYVRALVATGPAHEAIRTVGEAAFVAAATERALAYVREGLPLRASIAVVGFQARKAWR